MALRDRLDLTDAQERLAIRGLQLALVGLLAYGVVVGDPGVVVNSAGALAVSLLPVLLRREVGLRPDVGLVLWLTAAVFLHAVGILGPYREVWWWDYVTHALSASIVAGVGYAAVRAIDRNRPDVHLPEPYRSLVLFTFVVAVGVLWEVVEFVVTRISEALGRQSVLIVFGPEDIITDLIFTALGGLLVVVWGRGYFRGLSRKLARTLAIGRS